jgi:REP element-mobilizing transposase RayT
VTNHVHLIIRTQGDNLLSDILRDYKKYTRKVIIKAISENFRESRKEWLLKQFKTTEGFRFWQGNK